MLSKVSWQNSWKVCFYHCLAFFLSALLGHEHSLRPFFRRLTRYSEWSWWMKIVLYIYAPLFPLYPSMQNVLLNLLFFCHSQPFRYPSFLFIFTLKCCLLYTQARTNVKRYIIFTFHALTVYQAYDLLYSLKKYLRTSILREMPAENVGQSVGHGLSPFKRHRQLHFETYHRHQAGTIDQSFQFKINKNLSKDSIPLD